MTTPAVGTVSRAVRSFLAFDFGVKRVGVATGNSLLKSAQPLRTIAAEGDARFKAIAALVPGVLAGWLTYLAFASLAAIVYGSRLLGVVTDPSWLSGVFVLGPAVGLSSVVTGVIVSSRVNDPRVAQQIGGVIIVPIIAVTLVQATGSILVGASGYLLLAAGILAVSLLGLRIGVTLFDREAILTRWR